MNTFIYIYLIVAVTIGEPVSVLGVQVWVDVAVAVGVMYSAVPLYGQIWNSNEM